MCTFNKIRNFMGLCISLVSNSPASPFMCYCPGQVSISFQRGHASYWSGFRRGRTVAAMSKTRSSHIQVLIDSGAHNPVYSMTADGLASSDLDGFPLSPPHMAKAQQDEMIPLVNASTKLRRPGPKQILVQVHKISW